MVEKFRWGEPGAVWAMDYTESPTPIDGVYRYILIVRDLASGAQLLSTPVIKKTAEQTLYALRSLFRWHGPPLVLKSDNDGAFKDKRVRTLLDKQKVFLLLSPPGTPSYNGSVEAGIGTLKTRAHFES
ncbi:transposase family protein [Planctomycetota bacterium]